MPYQIHPGEFRLFYKSDRHVGSRPDGDSIWFKPTNPQTLVQLGDRSIDYNKGGFTQLRLEGIDALELHYKGSNHQSTPECVDERDKLLEFAGFTQVTYAPSSTSDVDTAVRESVPLSTIGYILTRGADIYGRPVSFVYTGNPPAPNNNNELWLTPTFVSQSMNSQLIAIGHAYPSFYTGLPYNLRNTLSSIMVNARNNSQGVWNVDNSRNGIHINNAQTLSQIAIWPKLYRRLFTFFKDGNIDISNFESWIRDPNHDRDDELWIISRGELGNLHDIFTVTNNVFTMTIDPEDMVIVPR